MFGPRAVVEYKKGAIVGGGKRHIGHNAGSAVAIFALLALVLAIAVTGFMLGQGNEAIKRIHEMLAWTTVGVVIVHVLGVAFHTVRHHENITASMIDGKKRAEATEAIPSAKPVVAVMLLIIAGGWAFGLVRNYNSATQATTLPLLGTFLQVGEKEGEDGEDGRDQGQRREDDD